MLRLTVVYSLVLFLATGMVYPKDTHTVQSPNGDVKVHFSINDSQQPVYSIMFKGQLILEDSPMGLVREDADFSRDFSLLSVSDMRTIEDQYYMQHGKQRAIMYKAHQKVFHLRHASGERMDIKFRVSDNGIAFQYVFTDTTDRKKYISEEKTTFNLPDDARAWLEPLANVNTGFANTNPSYEEHYYKDVAVGTAAPDSAGWAYPALFKANDTWLLISETGLRGSYSGTRLRQYSPNGEYRVGFPQAGEQFPGRALHPESTLPWSTPWRIIAVGSMGDIVESTLGTDLADPAAFTDTTWIEPGSASWSWAKLKDASVNYETQKEFIDYAAEMDWEYTLVDVNWDTTIGYDRMEELADYAATKDVGLLLWYNSSGSWNSTTYHPKSALLTHGDRVAEFSRLKEMGIKGIKVDFFAGDGQSMIQYYIDIFKDAAKYNLLVNTHGTTLPRGWHRTWPNLMTMESVKGFEYVTFDQGNADKQASHGTMLPYTRNVFSPMDYTPMSLTELYNVKRKTTNGYELALPVLFTSGIQHYAETADSMETVPEYVQDFIRTIPVSWDEIEFVQGYPGKLAVIARRAGNRWYVAGINGEDTKKKLSLDLSFISDKYRGEVITDGEENFSFRRSSVTLPDNGTVDISLEGNGGFVMFFEK